MIKKSFTYNTLFMTAANIITRFLGFAYRIFLSRFIGAGALGLFALVSPVYSVCCALVASGLPVAASKDISECIANNNKKEAKAATHASLLLVLLISVFLFLTIIVSAPALSLMLGDARTLSSLIAIGFAVLITGFENIYKSAFYAEGNVKVPAYTEIAEQILRIAAVVSFIILFSDKNEAKSSFILASGVFIGEALSLIILFFSYRKFSRQIKPSSVKSKIPSLLSTALPVTMSKTAETLLGSASNILIPAMLTLYGFSRGESTEILGVISGMVMPLLFLPAVFTNAISVNLVPFISANLATGNKGAVRRKTEKVLVVTALFSFPAFLGLAFYAEPIAEFVFSDSRVALFLPLMSLGAVLATFRHILSAILNAASLAKKASFYSFTGNALLLLLTVTLIPFFGISGYIFSYIISNVLLFIPTLVSVITVIPPEKNLFSKIVMPLFPAASSFYLSSYLNRTFFMVMHPVFSMILSFFIGFIIYIFSLLLLFKNKKIIFFSKKLD